MSEQLSDKETALLTELSTWARSHVDNDPNLTLLPVDPETYPAQNAFYIEGDPQHAAVVDSIATIVEPRFPEIQAKFQELEDSKGEVSRISELLKGNNNVVLITNHGELIDIAIAFAGLYGLLDKTEQKHDFRTGIMISKMVAMLGYKIGGEAAPAAEVLKIACDDIYLSFPRTESARKSKLSSLIPNEIDKHNKKLREKLNGRLREGGLLLGMAPSGSTDKPIDGNENIIGMGSVNKGTVDILKAPNTYVLPVAVWLKDKESVFEVCDIPRIISTDDQAHETMELIAYTLSQRVEGKQFIYQSPAHLGKAALQS